MADISAELEEIELASRGEEVRDSIINAFEKLNSEGPGTVSWDLVVDTPTTLAGYGITDARINEAAAEISPAEAAHAVGSYLIYDGGLYEVTAPIAIGDTLTAGTNISAVTIGEKLQALAAADDAIDLDIEHLEESLAPPEDSPAAAAHAAGSYIYYDGTLYRVTAPIAIGDALAVGTNIEATSAGDELKSIADRVDTAEDDIDSLESRMDDAEADLGKALANEAPAETSPAAAAHAAGEYIRYQNVLYKVTAPIAIGDALTPGTNVAAANFGGSMQTAEASIAGHSARISALEALGLSVVNGRLCQTYTA